MAKYQAAIAADHVLGNDTAAEHGADGPLAPRVIFTDPQVAAVGHTTQDRAATPGWRRASSTSRRRATPAAPTTAAARAARAGFLVDEQRGVLIGATITGSEVADFLHAATIAIVGEVPVDAPAPRRARVPDRGGDLAQAASRQLGCGEHSALTSAPTSAIAAPSANARWKPSVSASSRGTSPLERRGVLRGDGGEQREPDRAAHLARRVDQPGGEPGLRPVARRRSPRS